MFELNASTASRDTAIEFYDATIGLVVEELGKLLPNLGGALTKSEDYYFGPGSAMNKFYIYRLNLGNYYLKFNIDTHNYTHLQVSASMSKSYPNVYLNSQMPSIKVNLNRSVEALSKDIAKRVIPQAYAYSEEVLKEHQHNVEEHNQTVARLKDLAGNLENYSERGSYRFSLPNMQGTVSLVSYTDEVRLDLTLSHDLAKQVIDLIVGA